MGHFFYKGAKIICEERKYPIVTILAASKFGSAFENIKNKGIAHFVEHMLFKGTKNRTQKEISSTIEKIGGEINGVTFDFSTFYHITLPKKYFELGIDILCDMLANPVFDEREIEKEKKVVLEEWKKQQDTPSILVFKKLKEIIFGKPFGLPIVGNEKTIPNFNKNKVLDCFKFYTLNNLIFVIVGNINEKEIYSIIKEKIEENGIKKEKIYLPNIKIENRVGECKIKKNLKQAHICIGFSVPSLKDKKRYFPEILNCIYGEGMSCRLFQEIREKRALAYTAHSYIHQEKEYGFIAAYIGTSKEKIKEAKTAAILELKRKIEKNEFEEAKENLIGNYILENEKSINTAFDLAIEEIAGSYENHYDYEEKIKEVKYEDFISYVNSIKDISSVIIL